MTEIGKIGCIAVIIACILTGCIGQVEESNHVYIPGKGYFPSIQSAIENASKGDTIRIPPGTYNESLLIDKPVKLVGCGEKSIIRGKDHDAMSIITIKAENVSIKKLKIIPIKVQGGTFGIVIVARNALIEGNVILNCTYGICLKWSCENAVIEHNVISNNFYGIYSSLDSKKNTITRNNISWNHYGIRVKGKNNKIFENVLFHNELGIYMCCGSGGNIVYRNNFIGNNESARDDRYANEWSYGNEGNYWDDYNGTDANGDGIGDIPYYVPGAGHKKDEYPLMKPVRIDY